jgi:hypothetical protein
VGAIRRDIGGLITNWDRLDDRAACRVDLNDGTAKLLGVVNREVGFVQDPEGLLRDGTDVDNVIVLTTVPVDAAISLTVSLPSFATQTWVPSDDTPWGLEPTGIVLTMADAPAETAPTTRHTPASTATATAKRKRRTGSRRLCAAVTDEFTFRPGAAMIGLLKRPRQHGEVGF